MRPIDEILDRLKDYPEGVETRDLAVAMYPDAPVWEKDKHRCKIYDKLSKLEKYGLVESVLIDIDRGGHGSRLWRLAEDTI